MTDSATKVDHGELQEELAKLQLENENLKRIFVINEQEAEFVANKLFKRLEEKRQEKEILLQQLEQEEEFLTNNLQRRLREIRQDIVDVENQVEQEGEFLTNNLQKVISRAEAENEKLQDRLNKAAESRQHLQKNVDAYKTKLRTTEKDLFLQKGKNKSLELQLNRLKSDNFVLAQNISKGLEDLEAAKQTKILLEADLERVSEREFNQHSRQTKRGRSISCKVNPSSFLPSPSPGGSGMVFGSTSNPRPNPFARGFASEESNDLVVGSVPRMSASHRMNIPKTPFASVNSGSWMGSSPISISPSPVQLGMGVGTFGSVGTPKSFLHGSSPPSIASSPSFRGGISSPVGAKIADPSYSSNCVERGLVKKKRSDGSWGSCMLSVYDSGVLVCSDADSGVTLHINLDTVISLTDVSKRDSHDPVSIWNQHSSVFPQFTFELKTRVCSYFFSCDNESDFTKWTLVLVDLAPLCKNIL